MIRALDTAIDDPAAAERAAAVDTQIGLRVDSSIFASPEHEVVTVHPYLNWFIAYLVAQLDCVPMILDQHVPIPVRRRRFVISGGVTGGRHPTEREPADR